MKFQVNPKLSFYFKFVEFLCHNVEENGVIKGLVNPTINAVAG